MNNVVMLILDSCRFDVFMAAKKRFISRLGEAEKRYSYSSWTFPSHSTYLMGMSPHRNPKKVFASNVYRDDFLLWNNRLGLENLEFKKFVPTLSLPCLLKEYGYRNIGYVSLPVLNENTIFNRWFDEYQLMASHNDFGAILDRMTFSRDVPSFYFLNIGETHYPYDTSESGKSNLPRISGVHGVFKNLDDFVVRGGIHKAAVDTEEFFTQEEMNELKQKQLAAVEYIDSLFEKLYDMAPANTHFIVTADHGELFGEEDFFGHGPIIHEKVFEIPFLEGKLP
ncbi:MAG: metalloenzyme [Candidatus Omnitrophica bacterium]|nr:metalloenzyme [Candidatus Omnitrophota bacterium]